MLKFLKSVQLTGAVVVLALLCATLASASPAFIEEIPERVDQPENLGILPEGGDEKDEKKPDEPSDSEIDIRPEEGPYFEGDLKISEELVQYYYDIPGFAPSSGAPTRDPDIMLWPNGIIPFEIDNNSMPHAIETIKKAIDHWEESTCLRFVERTSQTDYVYFTSSEADGGCFSDSVGRKGGKQTVNLQTTADPNRPICSSFGVVVHEIGHAVGLWHENSRPDRDSYLRVIHENINMDYEFAFLKRKSCKDSSQGVGYSYGSIMHYKEDAFTVGNNRPTIEIIDKAAHQTQGMPQLGQRDSLSGMDILKVSRMYKCPSVFEAMEGDLKIFVRNAYDMPVRDSYVGITAVDSSGQEYHKETRVSEDSDAPSWYELLDFGRHNFSFFEIEIKQRDSPGSKESLRTFWINPDSPSAGLVRYDTCSNTSLLFGFAVIAEAAGTTQCSIEPCLNGGTCFDGPSSFTCACPSETTGSSCETRDGDDCASAPCDNGGTCVDELFNYTCSCPPESTGRDCETADGDDCASAPCDNGGTCVDELFNYTCSCPPESTGRDCETADADDCAPNPCLNGGVCVDGFFSYNCNCPAGFTGTRCETSTTLRGVLKVYIRNARNLKDTDPWLNDPDPFVRITAADVNGTVHTIESRVRDGTQNPTWNEWLDLGGCDFQPFLKIRIWDEDWGLTGNNDAMSAFETFSIEGGYHSSLRHDAYDSGYLTFDYNMTVDGNECSPNPCLNGGTCIDGISSYTCNCDTTYTGIRCETRLYRGILKVYVRYARSLKDTDPWLNDPDPYVRVIAVDSEDNEHQRKTAVKGGTKNPTWNQWLDVGGNTYQPFFKIQIWDKDSAFTGSDDTMSNSETVSIEPGLHNDLTHRAYDNGYLRYNYNMIMDGVECGSNPCQNGATCIEGIALYTCNCRSGYSGTDCEHRTGRLRIYARYGRNLPDRDGIWNKSDPYVEFIAVDSNGNTVRRTTSEKGGTHNPTWNQWIDFGTNTWKTFKMKVYDDDINSDDSLSSQQTRWLSRGSHTSLRHNCYSGYVIFDYKFY